MPDKPEPTYSVQVVVTEHVAAWNEPKKPSYPQDGSIYHEGTSRSVLALTTDADDKDAAIVKAQRQLEVERVNG
jgi:hypothetical protein